MTTIIVLFNLKPGVSRDDYEAWALGTDIPNVRGLKSVSEFSVLRASGLLGSEDKSPFEYFEIIRVDDMALFGEEVGTEKMTKVAAEFQAVADAPQFIMTESIEGGQA